MREIESEPGMHISQAAKLMVASGEDCFTSFNGICVAAPKGSTVEWICSEYDRLSEIRRQEYLASDEGKAFERQQALRREALQNKANACMEKLPKLLFSDAAGLLEWLCDIHDARDHIGVKVDNDLILRTFAAHGYFPNMNTGADFNENDRENFAGWIIGQAIQHPCPPLVKDFTEKWKARFGQPETKPESVAANSE